MPILFFFLANYVAHAMTVKSFPGERELHCHKATGGFIASFLVPFSSIVNYALQVMG